MKQIFDILSNQYNLIFLSLFSTFIWTLILTAVPVVVDVGPTNYYQGHDNWYTGADVMRFLEPIGGLPLNFWVLLQSGLFQRQSSQFNTFIIYLFMIAAAICQQG